MAIPVADSAPKSDVQVDEDVAQIAKRHRISPAIVREIMRRAGTTDRSVIEREITKGKARR
ncbi:hypothetical protein OF850_00885 [Roseococcus sp. MDT2-1-1]|uniref:DUF3606 domain-containing protein n=1 Tax=Sabulicella glaciei TaxID=2984948 RepID=A0ABT3NPT5_9PROT|nr:hypothetical protein [Roseococcus sp. MDT2-1-1]